MDVNGFVQQLLQGDDLSAMLEQPLADDISDQIVARFKQEADRHWWIDPNNSLKFARQIVLIGEGRKDLRQIALGTMAQGDALRFLGHLELAWDALEEAGRLFLSAGDEVGWARTRIGRLLMGADLNRIEQVIADADRAREIFERCHEDEKLMRLTINLAVTYSEGLGDHQRSLPLYQSALEMAQRLGAAGQSHLGPIYYAIGYAYNYLGVFDQALAFYERAHQLFVEQQDTNAAAVVEVNLAYLAQAQGRFRYALQLLHKAQSIWAQSMPMDAAIAGRDTVECYLLLNRYAEARELAQQIVADFRALGAANQTARVLLHLAIAEAELTNLEAAKVALDTAETIFASLGANFWVATVRLRAGRIALSQGAIDTALHDAQTAAIQFEQGKQQASYAEAVLLGGQALLAHRNLDNAAQSGSKVLHIARRNNLPSLRYSAHLLLGKVAEQEENIVRAGRHYRAAVETTERVQRHLTITLRPGFLEDKAEALRLLIGLFLRSNQVEQALNALERAKSQIFLSYLVNQGSLRWANEDSHTRTLVAELDRLRIEHHSFYGLAHNQGLETAERESGISPQQALAEVASRERRMRAITEQMYLYSGEDASNPIVVPSVSDIQRSQPADAILIEYYNDGRDLWAFTIAQDKIEVHALPITVAALDQLLAKLQFNLASALRSGPTAPATRQLTGIAQQILQRLYAGLIAPLASCLKDKQRLVIVPHGALHYLPFHLLHTGQQYLIEGYEIVVLPAAGLATRTAPRRSSGARILAHSWNGQLPETLAEAHLIKHLFGGTLYAEQNATRSAFQAAPCQLLHIAAHGEYRMDQPDLSYIELADGQLYTDDLLQHDLSYELVTLSACETGRANVAAGDELIGLGRGFLYAGAGALITSLWRISDERAVTLMQHLYRALREGYFKSAALREAQLMVLSAETRLHPAFWGAFQLVGDASPLSDSGLTVPKEQ